MAHITITPRMTIRTVVAEYPATTRLFAALGIDYNSDCKRTVNDAARTARMPVDALLAVLRTTVNQVGKPTNGEREKQATSPGMLLDYIIDIHHTFMRRELPRITQLMERVRQLHGDTHGEILVLLSATIATLRSMLEAHLAEEEERTFPMIHRLLAGTLDAESPRHSTR